jgi:molybdopterin synthase catalytic subunit
LKSGPRGRDLIVENRFAITESPLDASAIAALVADPGHGAVTIFVGAVRQVNLGRAVRRLEYEAYAPLAVRVFERIAREAADRWPEAALAIHHRIGTLAVGEASIVIAAAAPHRADGFAACRYAIERVKQIAPIWKREHFDDAEVWVEGATADPEDAGAREDALRRACA